MEWSLRGMRLLYREPSRDPNAVGPLVGDVVECDDPPFYEVDPQTMQVKAGCPLQCFQIDEGMSMRPVERGSWLANRQAAAKDGGE